MFANVAQGVKDWIDAPFKQQMSLVDIVLLIGLVIVASALWHLVLSYVSETVEI